jgi:hypothetical protein
MFDFLKRKRRDDDFENIRSNVLSRDMNEPDFPRFEKPEDVNDPLSPMADRRFGEQRFGEEPRFKEPPGFSDIDTRSDRYRDDKNFDVIDSLNLIESQLSAIRSQTETINERLKNIERQLPRRY